MGTRKDQWKILKTQQKSWKLFNITQDKSESNDLSQQYPKLLKEMVHEAEKWSRTHTEPKWFDPVELRKNWKENDMANFGSTFYLEP